tara:strand:- start:2608 stop:3486 length:879 start_codon:yes stop_codon:yes gene_type:complete
LQEFKSYRIGIVGAGALGGALAIALNKKGFCIIKIFSRSESSIRKLCSRLDDASLAKSVQEVSDNADIIFITTTDNAIKLSVESASWVKGQIVIHCSGVSGLDVLSKAKIDGASVGSMHPLQPFSDMDLGSKNLNNITFGIDGDKFAMDIISQLVNILDAISIRIDPRFRALYHLSGVMAGNLLLGMASSIADIWQKIGLSREDGAKALIPMMIQSCKNIIELGIPQSMAGPYVRGDYDTVKMHLESLQKSHPDILPMYVELAKISLKYADEKVGGTISQSKKILELLDEYN